MQRSLLLGWMGRSKSGKFFATTTNCCCRPWRCIVVVSSGLAWCRHWSVAGASATTHCSHSSQSGSFTQRHTNDQPAEVSLCKCGCYKAFPRYGHLCPTFPTIPEGLLVRPLSQMGKAIENQKIVSERDGALTCKPLNLSPPMESN